MKTPRFTQGLAQLHPCTIEETRKIASVRIHVERVIGLTRSKFKILNGPVQITTMKNQDDRTCLLDSIVTVCCILTNMCNSVVPLTLNKGINRYYNILCNFLLRHINEKIRTYFFIFK